MFRQIPATTLPRSSGNRPAKALLLLALLLICSLSEAAFQLAEQTGVTLAGSTGLVTIPTPDFASASRSIAFKYNVSDGSIFYNNSRVELSKDEMVLSARAKLDAEVEVSLVHLSYDRRSIAQLTGSARHYGLGVKYSPKNEANDMCVGFNFAPMTTSESILADVEQIESLRNVYVTVGEALSARVSGYLNVAAAFAGRQKIEFSDGTRRDVTRNDIYTATLAFACHLRNSLELYTEFKIGHYRNLLTGDSVRYRMHAGLRTGNEKYNLELTGFNVNENDPTLGLGVNMNF